MADFKITGSPIFPEELVKVTDMGHLVEIQHMEKMNTQNHITKLDKDHYVDNRTGEIHEFNKTENRKESKNSLRQTFRKLRYLINNNFTGNKNELFVTHTYKENVYDSKQVYKDVDKFMKRLRYKYKGVTSIDYLNVLEPHKKGDWHFHMLLRFNDLESVHIPNREYREMWGHGFVTVNSLKQVDNVGAYLSAYLCDIELTDETEAEAYKEHTEVVTKVVDGKEKKFIKGGRLDMYPTGMNLYRKSKGITHPERETMRYKKARKKVGSAEPHFSKTYEVATDDFQNNITYEHYNLRR